MPYWTSSRVGPIVVDIHKKKSKKKTDDVATKNTPPPPQRRGITMEVRLKTWYSLFAEKNWIESI